MSINAWPYQLELDATERIDAEVLVLGGGVAGCMAAIAAARAGRKVVLVEKDATKRSGAGGTGCDHWESAATNPCSRVSPEELTQAMLDDNEGYNNGISHYIECREGYDRLLEIEAMGGKIRDSDDEFKGAGFRDEATKFLFAYDYRNRFTLRIWGTSFKPAMRSELDRLGVRVIDRVMVTSLLTEGGITGGRCIGATGIHTRTGKFYVFSGRVSVMCMSRPARVWLFSAELPGLCEFRPTQCIGDGHAMGWKAGAEFTMMEKSVGAEFSAAGRSYPPYGAGNNHNTWYPADLIDAKGRTVPWADRDGRVLTDVSERFQPAPGQKFFMKGGSIDDPHHEIAGPETVGAAKLLEEGYALPFYADLSQLPELERKVIWGMMIGEEGKTRVPIYENYRAAGFDPERHVLQCYGTGWTSASFLPQERQLFGLPGGFVNDWRLRTSLSGLYAAGDSLFASNCFGHAAATGAYAGRHAAAEAATSAPIEPDSAQVEAERRRVQSPLSGNPEEGVGWKELNMGIAKTMQTYCGDPKRDELLSIGLARLDDYAQRVVPVGFAHNPHELTRLLEVFDILAVAQLILRSCLARRTSSKALCFTRTDSLELDPPRDRRFITIRQGAKGEVELGSLPLDYYGDLKAGYEAANADYARRAR